MNPRSRAVVAALALAPTMAVGLRARDEPAKAQAKAASPWLGQASSYRIAIGAAAAAAAPVALALREEPALKWSNPERRADDGSVFLWLDRGRPEVAASFYRFPKDGGQVEDNEFVTLSAAPLTARRDGVEVWNLPGGHVGPAPIPDAPKPAATPAERLRQMKALARDFHAHFNNPPDLSEIRPLPQPIYRFETEGKRPDVLDGALFAYVHTTDPEVLLAIEARTGPGGGPMAWHFSCARMSMVNLRVFFKDRQVWSCPWDNDYRGPTKPYMVLTYPVVPAGRSDRP